MQVQEDQENALYKLAYLELQADRKDVGLWAMALAESDGNIPKAEARYISKRVEQLKGDAGVQAQASQLPSAEPSLPLCQVRTQTLNQHIDREVHKFCSPISMQLLNWNSLDQFPRYAKKRVPRVVNLIVL